jgi:hypothetical protein
MEEGAPVTFLITDRWIPPCPRCGAGVLSHGKCFDCGLQMPAFSLSKGKRYEQDTRDWYEYQRIEENIHEHSITAGDGDGYDRSPFGI